MIWTLPDKEIPKVKTVSTSGCFDLLHPGHVYFLHKAKKLGDRLIVFLNTDASVRRLKGSSRPVIPYHEREYMLINLASVDDVIPLEDDTPSRLIVQTYPDVFVKGPDYEFSKIPEDVKDAVTFVGGELVILADGLEYSTTDLINRIKRL